MVADIFRKNKVKELISKLFLNTDILKRFLILIVVALQLLASSDAWSVSQGLGRTRICSPDGTISDNDGLDYNPTMGGKDAQFVLTNPVCLAVIAASYITVKGAIHYMNNACGRPQPVRWFPSLISDVADLGMSGSVCASGNPACCGGVAGATASFGSFLAYLGIIYGLAVDAYDKTKICGHGWYGPNSNDYLLNARIYESRTISFNDLNAAGFNAVGRSYSEFNTIGKIATQCSRASQGQSDLISFCDNILSTSNKNYREFFYGGVEVYDNPDEGQPCYDPYNRVPTAQRSLFASLIGESPNYHRQAYYMKGFEEGVFNCGRYDINSLTADPETGEPFTDERKNDFITAFACCKNRAENYVCINYDGERKFCRGGSNCTISKDIKFVTFSTQTQRNGSRICVETYNFCPYNFFISGGSEVCDYFQDNPNLTQDQIRNSNCGQSSEVRNPDCTFNQKAGKCENYCQHNVHCVKTSKIYAYRASDASPYFSEACINFIGDSRNRQGYGSGGNAVQFMNVSKRHFSAPIIQCFKETIENVFHNRAGHTRCRVDHRDGGIDISGYCNAGYEYRKGDSVYEFSFFERFQQTISVSIRIALSLVIMFYGMKILIASGEIKKKDMAMLIAKIVIVMYFATGSAWKDTFFDGVYNASDFFSTLVFKVQISEFEEELDGCQFGRVYTSIETGSQESSDRFSYPRGKEYLAIWDTLDCKLARYLGFGPGLEVATIANLVVAGWLIGPIGTYIVSIFFIFAFLMITVIIRAVHVFLASTIAIILLVFISPITITCVLTEKTKDIFNAWLKQLTSFAVQPMILCVFLAILVSVLDMSLRGNAVYYGDAPVKSINCDGYCVEEDGSYAYSAQGNLILPDNPDCHINGRDIVKPKTTSLECIIRADQYSSFPGLNLIGINIPFLVDFLIDDPKTRIQTIVKSLIVIYFLYKFMDEVPNIASQLFGGAKLPMSSIKVGDLYKNFHGKLKGVSSRLGRGAGKAAGSAKRGALRLAQSGKPKKDAAERSSGSIAGSSSGSSGGDSGSQSLGGDGGGGSDSSEA